MCFFVFRILFVFVGRSPNLSRIELAHPDKLFEPSHSQIWFLWL